MEAMPLLTRQDPIGGVSPWRAAPVLAGLLAGLFLACGGGAPAPSTPAATAPAILTQPASLTVDQGATAAFSVVASGTAPLHCQWRKGTLAVGGDAATLTLASAQPGDAGTYTVTVTNAAGSVTSSGATLTVIPTPVAVAPAILTQPASLTVDQGATAVFTVAASGTAPLHCQWRKGTLAVGGDAPTLTLASAQPADAGTYTVTVTNAAGSVTSDAATLTVQAASSTPANVNLALGKTATASSTESPAYPAALAVDGQASTRWSSAFTDSEWLKVDLGVAQTFNRVVLRWEAAFGKGYILEASSDGTAWAPLFTQTSGSGGVEDLTFPGTTARLVRLRGTARGTVYGYSLYELEVYRSVPLTLTATAGAHGSVSPAGAVQVAAGRSQTFTFTPEAGYTVDSVTVDGTSVGAVSSYTFASVQADHTLGVTFKVPAVFTITATAGPNGSISPAGAVAVTQGASQTFTVTPAPGYSVTGLAVDGASVGSTGSYTFANVQASHTIAATFGTTGGLVWSDEFDGPDIDPSKWAFDLGNGPTSNPVLYGWGNGEWESYTSSRDNATIENGALVITARRQSWGGWPFTSARLVTRGKFSFHHGRFVARIRMPEGNYMWPAFWLLGDHLDPWPRSGEIDIAEMFCGTVGRGDNAVFATAHWWDEAVSQHLMSGLTYTAPAKLSAGFHDYELEWDAQYLRGRIDGTEYWKMDISGSAMAELRNNSYYIILNLAIGFGLTSPDLVDGPMPQRMEVDFVRVYSVAGSSVEDKVAAQPHGTLGILADGTACDTRIDPDTGVSFSLWNNLAQVAGTPAAGSASLAVRTTGTAWFGCGLGAVQRRNLLNYAAGYLNFSLKTTSQDDFKIGINGGNDGDAWVSFPRGSDPYGFVRDGQWHRVSIPMTRFAGADFTDLRQFFMLASDDTRGLRVTAGQTYEVDEITWTETAPENRTRPSGTRYGIATERACDGGSFDAATEGTLVLWNKDNGVLGAGTPFEGIRAQAFTAPAAQWYGLGYVPTKLHDLSAFAKGHLHLALKVPASVTADFKLGIKSPGGPAVRESWIKFKAGADPYGFVRDGQYHELLIPAADLCNSDLSAVSILFMLAGDGPGTFEFDDIYWTAD